MLFGRRLDLGTTRGVLVAACLVGVSTLLLAPRQARAQYGYGGLFNFQVTPQEVTFLNQRSLQMTNLATMGPVQNNVYANNPNAWVNRLNSPSLLERYDPATREAIEHRVARSPSTPRPRPAVAQPQPQPQPATAPIAVAEPNAPSLPLSSFFDRYAKLVWPENAPTWGDLQEKRDLSDLSTTAVLNEYKLRGLATLGSVTTARTNLIAYGQPALEYIRENSTPRIADSFHMFLLSLYESLGQAATVPGTPAAPAQP